MCRLVAYAGPSTPVGPIVFGGSHSLYNQSWASQELLSGSVNADGWGVAWWPGSPGRAMDARHDERPPAGEGHPDEPAATAIGSAMTVDPGPLSIVRAEPIWYDPTVRRLLDAQRARVVQATLRNATPGLPVGREGVLPYVLDGRAFSLNGWVPSFRERHMRGLRTALSDVRYAALRGVSDAETLFLLVLDALDAGEGPADALRSVVGRVRARMAPDEAAPLTLVLSSSSGVETLHTALGDSPCNSLYVAEGASVAPEGAVLASEPLDDSGRWEAIPPESRVTLGSDGHVSVSSV